MRDNRNNDTIGITVHFFTNFGKKPYKRLPKRGWDGSWINVQTNTKHGLKSAGRYFYSVFELMDIIIEEALQNGVRLVAGNRTRQFLS